MKKIFQNLPLLDGNEEKYVLDCINSGWISSSGPYVKKFEESFAKYCDSSHGVSCSNGTVALHMALLALNIGPGDEVIVPNYTLIADSNMVILAGAKPVFVDVDKKNWCIDAKLIEEKITEKTKAIILVHMYGHACNINEIREICKTKNIKIIEDAAQAHGTLYKQKKIGSFGDVACFSFYATKTLTSGEGGIILTNSKDLADKLKLIRSHGFEPGDRRYIHKTFGLNYRISNIQAAIALAQVEKADEIVSKKIKIAELYKQELSSLKEVIFQEEDNWTQSSWWNVVIALKNPSQSMREQLRNYLSSNNIESRLPFQSLHKQPLYSNPIIENYPTQFTENFPISDWLSHSSLCLPSSASLTEEEIKYITKTIINFFNQ